MERCSKAREVRSKARTVHAGRYEAIWSVNSGGRESSGKTTHGEGGIGDLEGASAPRTARRRLLRPAILDVEILDAEILDVEILDVEVMGDAGDRGVG